MSSHRLPPNLNFMRDWVQKPLENIRLNKLYYRIPEESTAENTIIRTMFIRVREY